MAKMKVMAILMVGTLLFAGLLSICAMAKEPVIKDENGLEESPFVTCFAFGTKITMADGSYKNVEDIQKGDIVKSYSLKNGVPSKFTVNEVSHPNRHVYTILLENGKELKVTEDHPLYIKKSNGFVGWGQLVVMPRHVRLRGQDIQQIQSGDQV